MQWHVVEDRKKSIRRICRSIIDFTKSSKKQAPPHPRDHKMMRKKQKKTKTKTLSARHDGEKTSAHITHTHPHARQPNNMKLWRRKCLIHPPRVKWVDGLHNPCHPGVPQRFKARVGRPLAFRRDSPPPVEVGRRPLGGGGLFLGGGLAAKKGFSKGLASRC